MNRYFQKPKSWFRRVMAISGVFAVVSLTACGNDNVDKTSTLPAAKDVSVKPVVVEPVKSIAKAEPRTVTPIVGSTIYKRCAACHLLSAEGVLGAFPPLAKRLGWAMDSEPAREYLTLVTLYGVSGSLTVDGNVYSGFMPAQGGMSNAKAAAVLNYIMENFNDVSPDHANRFTEAYVASVRLKNGKLSGRKVYGKREAVFEGQSE